MYFIYLKYAHIGCVFGAQSLKECNNFKAVHNIDIGSISEIDINHLHMCRIKLKGRCEVCARLYHNV